MTNPILLFFIISLSSRIKLMLAIRYINVSVIVERTQIPMITISDSIGAPPSFLLLTHAAAPGVDLLISFFPRRKPLPDSTVTPLQRYP